MKKFFLSIVLAFTLSNIAQAQNAFFGVNPEKFTSLLTQVQKMPRENALMIVDQTMKLMGETPKGYRRVLELTLPRLGEPTDSLHNEDLYIAVLKHAASSSVLSSSEKARPQALLESALKNSAGTVAADIDYVTLDGTKGNLLNNDNKFTLVYFNDPDCDACAKVKENLDASSAVKQAVETGLLRLVAINPMSNEKQWKKAKMPQWIINGWNKSQSINEGGSYDLPTLPVFFVLGRDNTVLAKNEASLKRVERIVATIMANSSKDSNTLVNMVFNK